MVSSVSTRCSLGGDVARRGPVYREGDAAGPWRPRARVHHDGWRNRPRCQVGKRCLSLFSRTVGKIGTGTFFPGAVLRARLRTPSNRVLFKPPGREKAPLTRWGRGETVCPRGLQEEETPGPTHFVRLIEPRRRPLTRSPPPIHWTMTFKRVRDTARMKHIARGPGTFLRMSRHARSASVFLRRPGPNGRHEAREGD